jgi:hypothetical protein
VTVPEKPKEVVRVTVPEKPKEVVRVTVPEKPKEVVRVTVPEKLKSTENSKPKKSISKQELCKMIARHYMVRANLVAAIASSLPINAAEPGFCQSRISALERGDICLPQDYASVQAMPMLKASSILSKYVNVFNHNDCKAINGYYREHNYERMKKINNYVGDNELQKIYITHLNKMKMEYYISLETLKEILKELMNNPDMTNMDLKILSEKTKETLDNMYADCQYDYILGLIALLQLDYQLPRISTESMNNLISALKLRVKR